MIIRLKKFLFIGVKEDMARFFERAQKEGFIEFIKPSQESLRKVSSNQEILVEALKILRKMPRAKQACSLKSLDPTKLAHLVVENKKKLEKFKEEQKILKAEMARLAPIGDFSLDEIKEIERQSNKQIQFFCVKRSKTEKVSVPSEFFYLSSKQDLDYYMSIDETVKEIPDMTEIYFEKSVSQIREELSFLEKGIKECERELGEDVVYINCLSKHLTLQINQDELQFAQNDVDTHLDGSLFAINAWVPKNRLHSLFPVLESLGIHAEEIAIEKEDRIPTFMENKKVGKLGEDLVQIYDIPAISDKDPSRWVFWSFIVFYAMIISDAGYGLIYLALSLFLKKKFSNFSAPVKRMVNLFMALSIGVIVWGVLAGSYFGICVQPKNPVNRVSFIHFLAVRQADYTVKMKDDNYREMIDQFPKLEGIKDPRLILQKGSVEMGGGRVKYAVYDDLRNSIFMELSLIVGVIHICLSLIRHTKRYYAGVGWILAILGGYVYFPHVLDTTSLIHVLGWVSKETGFKVGFKFLIGGFSLAIILSCVQNRIKGLIDIGKSIEIFADILSYLRLYALGLAGMILAETFNGMGEKLHIVFGSLLILFGHTINMVIGIMGGTIHGLRLNFIEWYHHCFSGGGKIFNPLKIIKS